MITVFADELTRVSTELQDHLENQAALIAPERSEQNVLNQIKATLQVGRDWSEAMSRSTRRREFTKFQAEQPITPAEGRKAMKVYQQFGDWAEGKLLVINGAVSLATLCHPKFATVVQQLRAAVKLSKEFVKNLVKEVRDATKAQRKKKQQPDSGSGWRQDPSGGGRYYQLPPMYNEAAAMKIETIATEQGVRAIAVVEEAITTYGEQPATDDLKRQHQELQAVVSEVRDEHIQMQRKLIERDAHIKELERLIQMPAPELVGHSFSTWTEFADTVECDDCFAGLSLRARTSLISELIPILYEDALN